MSKYIDAEKITPIMAEYVADVFSRKEHLDNISYGYCMEIADVFRQYAERAKQEQPEVDLEKEINRFWDSCTKHKNEIGNNVIWSNKLEVKVLARHFAEWGAIHLNARRV